MSAIKHKKGKQSFSQQQQSSAPSGGSDGAAEKKKSRRSKRAGKQVKERQNHAHLASSAMVVDSVPTMMDLPQSVVDPRSLGNLPIADTSGVPAFPQVRAAIVLARRIGVEPTCERVRRIGKCRR